MGFQQPYVGHDGRADGGKIDPNQHVPTIADRYDRALDLPLRGGLPGGCLGTGHQVHRRIQQTNAIVDHCRGDDRQHVVIAGVVGLKLFSEADIA